MEHHFWKYQGTGNDFIFFDGRQDVSEIKDNKEVIASLCDRRYGIGADGLIILEEHQEFDFRMIYYNSDGSESTMCGNGGRCSIAFAQLTGFAGSECEFLAVDGPHMGKVVERNWIELGMNDVNEVQNLDRNKFVLNTGSPHFVRMLLEKERVDIERYGREIRYSTPYHNEGINVNTVRVTDEGLNVETYERGVEAETFSCGTGVTAAAMAFHRYSNNKFANNSINVITKGGRLQVNFTYHHGKYTQVTLAGPAVLVFKGKITT